MIAEPTLEMQVELLTQKVEDYDWALKRLIDVLIKEMPADGLPFVVAAVDRVMAQWQEKREVRTFLANEVNRE